MAKPKVQKISYNTDFPEVLTKSASKVKENWFQNHKQTTPVIIEENKVEVLQYPFPVCLLRNFTDSNLLKDVVKELSSYEFHPKNNDLYEFSQTTDLVNLHRGQAVENLYNVIKNLRKWVANTLACYPLKEGISATFSCYQSGNTLLCHDDKCDDRHIAWVLYLTDGWSKNFGGTLDLFETEDGHPGGTVHSITPTFNTLVLFEVTDTSYHQVKEVVVKGKKRYSLNGWFHCEREKTEGIRKLIELRGKSPGEVDVDLESLILVNYLQIPNQLDIRTNFVETSEIQLLDFFLPQPWTQIRDELNSYDIKWISAGPANIRKYDIADESSLPPFLLNLLNILTSHAWLRFLKTITGLDLAPSSNSDMLSWLRGRPPLCHVELQRCLPGSYSLAHDGDPEFYSAALDAILRIPMSALHDDEDHEPEDDEPSSGHVIYVDKTSENDECLLHLGYKYNSLGLIYRDSSTIRFLKYLKNSSVPFYQIQCTYRSWLPPEDEPDLKHNPDQSDSDNMSEVEPEEEEEEEDLTKDEATVDLTSDSN